MRRTAFIITTNYSSRAKSSSQRHNLLQFNVPVTESTWNWLMKIFLILPVFSRSNGSILQLCRRSNIFLFFFGFFLPNFWTACTHFNQLLLNRILFAFMFFDFLYPLVLVEERTFVARSEACCLFTAKCFLPFLCSVALTKNQRPLWVYDYFAWWSTCISISRKEENVLALLQK